MPCQSDIETVTGLSFSEINEQINNITDDFITINSFFVYDKFYNELLLIDPSKHYAIYTIRRIDIYIKVFGYWEVLIKLCKYK